ncbi:hypothetical protein E2P81_ATG04743 [Venturia nashicola]|nr:hypothetical protein E2P81_ATG04743 [Venturia nashicola]
MGQSRAFLGSVAGTKILPREAPSPAASSGKGNLEPSVNHVQATEVMEAGSRGFLEVELAWLGALSVLDGTGEASRLAGIQACRHPGLQASRLAGIQACEARHSGLLRLPQSGTQASTVRHSGFHSQALRLPQ